MNEFEADINGEAFHGGMNDKFNHIRLVRKLKDKFDVRVTLVRDSKVLSIPNSSNLKRSNQSGDTIKLNGKKATVNITTVANDMETLRDLVLFLENCEDGVTGETRAPRPWISQNQNGTAAVAAKRKELATAAANFTTGGGRPGGKAAISKKGIEVARKAKFKESGNEAPGIRLKRSLPPSPQPPSRPLPSQSRQPAPRSAALAFLEPGALEKHARGQLNMAANTSSRSLNATFAPKQQPLSFGLNRPASSPLSSACSPRRPAVLHGIFSPRHHRTSTNSAATGNGDSDSDDSLDETRSTLSSQPSSSFSSSSSRSRPNLQEQSRLNFAASIQQSSELQRRNHPTSNVGCRSSGRGFQRLATLSSTNTMSPERRRSTLDGFANLGNTCFMNAVMAALLHQKDFVRDLSSPVWTEPLRRHFLERKRKLSFVSADDNEALGSSYSSIATTTIDCGSSADACLDLTSPKPSGGTSTTTAEEAGDGLMDSGDEAPLPPSRRLNSPAASSASSASSAVAVATTNATTTATIATSNNTSGKKDGRMVGSLLRVVERFLNRRHRKQQQQQQRQQELKEGVASPSPALTKAFIEVRFSDQSQWRSTKEEEAPVREDAEEAAPHKNRQRRTLFIWNADMSNYKDKDGDLLASLSTPIQTSTAHSASTRRENKLSGGKKETISRNDNEQTNVLDISNNDSSSDDDEIGGYKFEQKRKHMGSSSGSSDVNNADRNDTNHGSRRRPSNESVLNVIYADKQARPNHKQSQPTTSRVTSNRLDLFVGLPTSVPSAMAQTNKWDFETQEAALVASINETTEHIVAKLKSGKFDAIEFPRAQSDPLVLLGIERMLLSNALASKSSVSPSSSPSSLRGKSVVVGKTLTLPSDVSDDDTALLPAACSALLESVEVIEKCATGAIELAAAMRLHFKKKLKEKKNEAAGCYGEGVATTTITPNPTLCKINEVISMKQLKHEVERVSGRFVGNDQQDAHEFFGDLLNAIDDDLAPFSLEALEELHRHRHQQQAKDWLKLLPTVSVGVKEVVAGVSSSGTNKTAAEALATAPDWRSEKGEEEKPESKVEVTEEKREDAEMAAKTKAMMLLPTNRNFHTQVEVELSCDRCHYARSLVEDYRELSLHLVKPSHSISSSSSRNNKSGSDGNDKIFMEDLLRHFFGQESLELTCEKCGHTRATKSTKLKTLPHTLVLHLKRFEQISPLSTRFVKRTDAVAFKSEEGGRGNNSSDDDDGVSVGVLRKRGLILDLSEHCTPRTVSIRNLDNIDEGIDTNNDPTSIDPTTPCYSSSTRALATSSSLPLSLYALDVATPLPPHEPAGTHTTSSSSRNALPSSSSSSSSSSFPFSFFADCDEGEESQKENNDESSERKRKKALSKQRLKPNLAKEQKRVGHDHIRIDDDEDDDKHIDLFHDSNDEMASSSSSSSSVLRIDLSTSSIQTKSAAAADAILTAAANRKQRIFGGGSGESIRCDGDSRKNDNVMETGEMSSAQSLFDNLPVSTRSPTSLLASPPSAMSASQLQQHSSTSGTPATTDDGRSGSCRIEKMSALQQKQMENQQQLDFVNKRAQKELQQQSMKSSDVNKKKPRWSTDRADKGSVCASPTLREEMQSKAKNNTGGRKGSQTSVISDDDDDDDDDQDMKRAMAESLKWGEMERSVLDGISSSSGNDNATYSGGRFDSKCTSDGDVVVDVSDDISKHERTDVVKTVDVSFDDDDDDGLNEDDQQNEVTGRRQRQKPDQSTKNAMTRTWVCSACTFENDAMQVFPAAESQIPNSDAVAVAEVCTICLAPRPKTPPPTSSSISSSTPTSPGAQSLPSGGKQKAPTPTPEPHRTGHVPKARYALSAVVHHLGATAFAGHYVASVRCDDEDTTDTAGTGKDTSSGGVSGDGTGASSSSSALSSWVLFDDAHTSREDEAAVLERAETEGYIYFFRAV